MLNLRSVLFLSLTPVYLCTGNCKGGILAHTCCSGCGQLCVHYQWQLIAQPHPAVCRSLDGLCLCPRRRTVGSDGNAGHQLLSLPSFSVSKAAPGRGPFVTHEKLNHVIVQYGCQCLCMPYLVSHADSHLLFLCSLIMFTSLTIPFICLFFVLFCFCVLFFFLRVSTVLFSRPA